MQVSEVLRVKGNRLVTVPPETSLDDCAMAMAEHDIGSLVVMNGAAFVGIVTFREVLRVLARRRIEQRIASSPGADVAVRDVMIPSPYLATPTMDVNELRLMMIEHRQRYLPVMEGDLLLGVISFHDVAKAVLEENGFQNRMQRSYIRDWPVEL
jgi:CBS domain-containing protein